MITRYRIVEVKTLSNYVRYSLSHNKIFHTSKDAVREADSIANSLIEQNPNLKKFKFITNDSDFESCSDNFIYRVIVISNARVITSIYIYPLECHDNDIRYTYRDANIVWEKNKFNVYLAGFNIDYFPVLPEALTFIDSLIFSCELQNSCDLPNSDIINNRKKLGGYWND